MILRAYTSQTETSSSKICSTETETNQTQSRTLTVETNSSGTSLRSGNQITGEYSTSGSSSSSASFDETVANQDLTVISSQTEEIVSSFTGSGSDRFRDYTTTDSNYSHEPSPIKRPRTRRSSRQVRAARPTSSRLLAPETQ